MHRTPSQPQTWQPTAPLILPMVGLMATEKTPKILASAVCWLAMERLAMCRRYSGAKAMKEDFSVCRAAEGKKGMKNGG